MFSTYFMPFFVFLNVLKFFVQFFQSTPHFLLVRFFFSFFLKFVLFSYFLPFCFSFFNALHNFLFCSLIELVNVYGLLFKNTSFSMIIFIILRIFPQLLNHFFVLVNFKHDMKCALQVRTSCFRCTVYSGVHNWINVLKMNVLVILLVVKHFRWGKWIFLLCI